MKNGCFLIYIILTGRPHAPAQSFYFRFPLPGNAAVRPVRAMEHSEAVGIQRAVCAESFLRETLLPVRRAYRFGLPFFQRPEERSLIKVLAGADTAVGKYYDRSRIVRHAVI